MGHGRRRRWGCNGPCAGTQYTEPVGCQTYWGAPAYTTWNPWRNWSSAYQPYTATWSVLQPQPGFECREKIHKKKKHGHKRIVRKVKCKPRCVYNGRCGGGWGGRGWGGGWGGRGCGGAWYGW